MTAGTVDIGAIANFTFAPGSAGCPQPIGQGDSCVAPATVNYVGTLAADLDFSLSDSDSYCFSSTGTVGATPIAPGAEVLSAVGPAPYAVTITTTLDSPDNGCQGHANTVTLTVLATES